MPQAAAPGPMAAPAAPAAPDKPKGAIGIWIGILLVIGGIVLGVVLVVTGAKSLIDGFDDLERVSIISGGIVEIDEPGTQTIYAERPAPGAGGGFNTSTSSGFVPNIAVQIIGPDGQEIQRQPLSGSESYTYDGREGVAIGEFEAPTEGDYRIIPSGEDVGGIYTTIAVGEALQLGGIGAILGGIFGGGLVVLLGIIVIIVFAVRRSRSKKRIAQSQNPYPGSYGAVPAGWPAAPAPGYGAPAGYGAPGGYGAPPAPGAPAPGGWPATSNPGWVPPPVSQPGPGAAEPTWTPPGQQPPAPAPAEPLPSWPTPPPPSQAPWQPPAPDAPGAPADAPAPSTDAPPPPPPPAPPADGGVAPS